MTKVLRDRIVELCLQYHAHKIRQICWTTTPPYNPIANKEHMVNIVVGIQNLMNDIDKERDNQHTELARDDLQRSLLAVQHNVIIALFEVKETKKPLTQVLTSLVSLLYKRRLNGDEDLHRLLDYEVTSDALWLLFNITIALIATSTFQHLDIAYQLLRKMHEWLTMEIETRKIASPSTYHSFLDMEGLHFIHLRVLYSLVLLDVRFKEQSFSWPYNLSKQYEQGHLQALQHSLDSTENILNTQTWNEILWRLLIRHYLLLLELVKVKRQIIDHVQSEKEMHISNIDDSVVKITDTFKANLSKIHGATLNVSIYHEVHCNMIVTVHDLIADFQQANSALASNSRDSSTFAADIKISGNKLVVKLNLIKVQVLILKTNYSEAQSLLQSMLANCDNEHDQSAILNNITLFRPWSGPDGLADLTYNKSLSFQLDHRRIFGRIQCSAANLSRIAYNLALTQMKASRFCEAYYLLAMLPLTNQHEFSRSPLYLLRVGECCIHHHRVTVMQPTFPRYYVRTTASYNRKYYSLMLDPRRSSTSQSDLEKKLEEIAQPFQISPCHLHSARKYLYTAFFFSESGSMGDELVQKRICENIMFVSASLQDPYAVQFYGSLLQRNGLNHSDFFANTMAKSYLDQGRILQSIATLQSRLSPSLPVQPTKEAYDFAISRNQCIARADLNMPNHEKFSKLVLGSNSILASSQSLSSQQLLKNDEILKVQPNFVLSWYLKFLQCVEQKDIDALNGFITAYYKHSS